MKTLIVSGIIAVCMVLMYQYPHTMLNPGELAEGHQKLNDKCLACHNPFWGISNDKCASCHKLSDFGRDTLQLSAANATKVNVMFHQHLSNQKCTTCHTDHKGQKPEMSLSSFNHELLSAAVTGKCNSCHSKPVDNLHSLLASTCNDCHNTKGWKNAVVFNHNMIQGIVKNNCSSCHNKPGDSFHQELKDNCDKCHSTSQWKPSTFDHSIYFLLDGDHNAPCSTCHTNNNFSAFTCYGCHKHSESKIIGEHNEEGIYNIANCASCHRSGNEHDIRRNGNSNQKSNKNELNNVKKYIKSEGKENKEKREHDDD